MKEIVARKNKRAYHVDRVKIVCGGLLSVLWVAVILIFRNVRAFTKGSYSLLDFTLLFLLLSAGLAANGIKALRNHRKMPDVMLTFDDERLVILDKEIPVGDLKDLKGRFEFGHTGTIYVITETETYRLYGVKNYADVINAIIAQLRKTQNP